MSFGENYSKKLNKTSIDSSSIDSKQTNLSNYENLKQNKIKTVFFNSVEIIDVESYKKYNLENEDEIVEEEENNNNNNIKEDNKQLVGETNIVTTHGCCTII